MLLLVATEVGHLLLEQVVVADELLQLLLQSVVAQLALELVLLFAETPVGALGTESLNLLLGFTDLVGRGAVIFKEGAVVSGLLFGISNVLVEMNFEFLIEFLNLLDQLVLHRLKLLDILVFGLFAETVVSVAHVTKLLLLLFFDGLNHFIKLTVLHVVAVFDISALTVVFVLNHVEVHFKFNLETQQA